MGSIDFNYDINLHHEGFPQLQIVNFQDFFGMAVLLEHAHGFKPVFKYLVRQEANRSASYA